MQQLSILRNEWINGKLYNCKMLQKLKQQYKTRRLKAGIKGLLVLSDWSPIIQVYFIHSPSKSSCFLNLFLFQNFKRFPGGRFISRASIGSAIYQKCIYISAYLKKKINKGITYRMLSHYFIAPKTPLLSCPSNFIHFWVVFYFFFLHRLLILIGFLLTFARKLMRLPPGRQYRRSLPASAQTLHSIMVMSYVIIKHDILCKRIQLSTVALPFLFYQIKKKT